MAASSTVIAALRYADGIVIGADSQVSDHNARVRWSVEKLHQVGSWPLVVGFSGSLGIATRARRDIESIGWRSTTFKNPERVQKAIAAAVTPHIETLRASMDPGHPFNHVFGMQGLSGLTAYYAKEPTILELEPSGDRFVHSHFHAIGSGAQTAHAIWRTIGGRELSALDEGLALDVMLRILQTCVDVEMAGVGGPFTVYIVSAKGARRLSNHELDFVEQAVHEWQRRELDLLLGRQPTSEGPSQ